MTERDTRELELRVAGAGDPGRAEALGAALRALDPAATARHDPETGILHVTTVRDTLEVDAALTQAGFEVTAMTG